MVSRPFLHVFILFEIKAVVTGQSFWSGSIRLNKWNYSTNQESYVKRGWRKLVGGVIMWSDFLSVTMAKRENLPMQRGVSSMRCCYFRINRASGDGERRGIARKKLFFDYHIICLQYTVRCSMRETGLPQPAWSWICDKCTVGHWHSWKIERLLPYQAHTSAARVQKAQTISRVYFLNWLFDKKKSGEWAIPDSAIDPSSTNIHVRRNKCSLSANQNGCCYKAVTQTVNETPTSMRKYKPTRYGSKACICERQQNLTPVTNVCLEGCRGVKDRHARGVIYRTGCTLEST